MSQQIEDLRWVGGGDYPDPADESIDTLLLTCPYIPVPTAWITVEAFDRERSEELLRLDNDGKVARGAQGWYCEECGNHHPHDIVLAEAAGD